MQSPFLARPEAEHLAQNALAFALRDAFPVSPGHSLVVPRRPVARWDEATADEKAAMLALVDELMAQLRASHAPDGFNVGFNDGPAAGQTVPHLHVHVIPRYAGDRPDPRGGLRWVLPAKADYWSRR